MTSAGSDSSSPQEELPGVGKATWSVLATVGGVVGLVASGAQVIDYAQNNVALLFFFIGGLLIFLPFAVAFEYLRHLGQKIAQRYVLIAFFCVSIGVLAIVSTSNLAAGDPTNSNNNGYTKSSPSDAALRRCQSVPELRGDPARLRVCAPLRLSLSAADLDTKDVAWGNPGADLTKSADVALDSGPSINTNSKSNAAINSAGLTYESCKSLSVWRKSISYEADAESTLCLITDQGRMAEIFIKDYNRVDYPFNLDAYVLVWDLK